MRRVLQVAAWIPAVALIVGTVAAVAAFEIAPNSSRADVGSPAEQSPRYLRHDEQNARPLPGAPGQSITTSPADTLAPQLRATERLASGESGDTNAKRRPSADVHREIPLSPPATEARRSLGGGEMPALATGAASLGIVLGLFLVVIWAVRRGLPGGSGVLPSEAVEVLGRAPLIGKQNAHLLRCGGKLLLVCFSPGSAQTLTEITDPVEVERLEELCRSKRGATASFRDTLEQFGGKQSSRYLSEEQAQELNFGALDADGTYSRAKAPLT